jgi:hypothetical protein
MVRKIDSYKDKYVLIFRTEESRIHFFSLRIWWDVRNSIDFSVQPLITKQRLDKYEKARTIVWLENLVQHAHIYF